MKIKRIAKILIFTFFFSLFTFKFCDAAVLFLSPASGEYYKNDTFIIEIRLDTEEENINATEISLTFSSALLEVIDFSKGNSILTLFVEEPRKEEGKISFSGGVPGGFKGQGIIGKIIFRATSAGLAQINFQESSRVLLNDGLGTQAKLTTREGEYRILPAVREIPADEWNEELRKDNIPPESFTVELGQMDVLFEGKYFIVFSTEDKQTGIDHYEISETKNKEQEAWKSSESPYILEDQSLDSKILVKAIDKAGNERITEFIPPKKPFPYGIAALIILITVIIWWIARKLNIKYKKSNITNEI